MPVIVIRVARLVVLRVQWVVWLLRGRQGPNPWTNGMRTQSLPSIVPIFQHSACGSSRVQEEDSAQV